MAYITGTEYGTVYQISSDTYSVEFFDNSHTEAIFIPKNKEVRIFCTSDEELFINHWDYATIGMQEGEIELGNHTRSTILTKNQHAKLNNGVFSFQASCSETQPTTFLFMGYNIQPPMQSM